MPISSIPPAPCSAATATLEPTEPLCVELSRTAIAAWDDYKATGFHVTHAEADAWLAQLQEGNDVEPPVCHV